MKTRGVSYSTAPQLESRRGSQLGVIQLGELLEAGIKVSISTDHIASASCDPFSSMRILFALHSHRIGARVPLTLKRMLQLATLDGAVDLGIADRTGSITPGKRADLVLVRTTYTNMAPIGDPYEALVSFALPSNVDTVLIDGRILRRAGKSTAFDDAQILAQTREAAAGLRDKARWPT
jgi:5-methylthioadenosine/S-adenosylhomocysteine deaminase